ncbi:MAG: hypothetical protein ABI671_16050 [Burkholderiales bacterium]
MSTLITLAWPVRPGAPDWRSEDGESLALCVARWLHSQVVDGRFPPAAEFAKAAKSGNYCGLSARDDEIEELIFLVTPAAMTACIAELGLACATPAELHHVLFDLVKDGHMQKHLEVFTLPVLGDMPMYRITSTMMGVQK